MVAAACGGREQRTGKGVSEEMEGVSGERKPQMLRDGAGRGNGAESLPASVQVRIAALATGLGYAVRWRPANR